MRPNPLQRASPEARFFWRTGRTNSGLRSRGSGIRCPMTLFSRLTLAGAMCLAFGMLSATPAAAAQSKKQKDKAAKDAADSAPILMSKTGGGGGGGWADVKE